MRRCRTRADFAVFKRARRHNGRYLWLRYVVPAHVVEPVVEPVVGLAVGRQVGNAVKRNRLRRQLWAVLRDLSADMPAGYYLFGARSSARGVSFASLTEQVSELVARVKSSSEPAR